MNHLRPLTSDALGSVSHVFNQSLQKAQEWFGHAVTLVMQTPETLGRNPNAAIAVIAATNTLFLFIVNSAIQYLDARLFETQEQRSWTQLIFDEGVCAGAFFAFNSVVVPKLTKTELSASLVSAIAVLAIALRTFYNHVRQNEEAKASAVEQPPVEVEEFVEAHGKEHQEHEQKIAALEADIAAIKKNTKTEQKSLEEAINKLKVERDQAVAAKDTAVSDKTTAVEAKTKAEEQKNEAETARDAAITDAKKANEEAEKATKEKLRMEEEKNKAYDEKKAAEGRIEKLEQELQAKDAIIAGFSKNKDGTTAEADKPAAAKAATPKKGEREVSSSSAKTPGRHARAKPVEMLPKAGNEAVKREKTTITNRKLAGGKK